MRVASRAELNFQSEPVTETAAWESHAAIHHGRPRLPPCGAEKVALLFASALTLAFGVNHPVVSLTNGSARALPGVRDRRRCPDELRNAPQRFLKKKNEKNNNVEIVCLEVETGHGVGTFEFLLFVCFIYSIYKISPMLRQLFE